MQDKKITISDKNLYCIAKQLILLRKEKLRWYLKIKKALAITFVMRRIFCYDRLEITINTKPNGDKEIWIFDKDTMIDYQWIAPLHNQHIVNRDDGSTGEYYKLVKPT